MNLSGDRNQCRGCGEYFNSTFAFDKHRTGEFGKGRRCMTVQEMEAKGMSKNAAGFWISSAMPLEVAHNRDSEPDPAVEHSISMMARAHGWIGY